MGRCKNLFHNSNFSVLDFGVHSKGVDLEFKLYFLSWLNAVELTLNLGLEPTPTVAKHAAFRLCLLFRKNGLNW
jgi:hypothetical protein